MSRPHALPLELSVLHLQQRIAQQEMLVHRMILQGAPTQAAEDQLRDLQRRLLHMEKPRVRAAEVLRKMRDRRK